MEQKGFDSRHIQQVIGYEFKNIGLLTQAFTRKSYVQEHPGIADNEVLEFYGDAALNLYTCREMSRFLGKIETLQYVSEKNEQELSEIRSWLVRKEKLSHCIQILGLEKFLFLNESDIKNKVWESKSVKEDLFEAILGAVAIDCNWNYENINTVCENLFSVNNFTENYVAKLQEECKKRGWAEPIAWDDLYFKRMQIKQAEVSIFSYQQLDSPNLNMLPIEEKFSFRIPNLKNTISEYRPAYARTKASSIMLAAKNVYEWLLKRDKIQKYIVKIDENFAANQLHELRQKGLIKDPKYEFSETGHDKDGNPIWNCKCKLEGTDYPFEAEDTSKKKAKQKASAKALFFLIGEERILDNSKEEN